MEFAVFSDVHGNIYALEEMLRQTEKCGINNYIFCGDIVGYFLHQEEVIDHLRRLPGLFAVKGNHDEYYLSTLGNSRVSEYYAEKYGKSHTRRLTDRALRYLESLPESVDICIERKRVLIVHGSKEQYLEGRVYPDTEVSEDTYRDYDFVFLGHTHYRMYRKIGKTVLLNPGSLGQPRDKGGYSFCTVNMETGECCFHTVCLNQDLLLKELSLSQERPELIRYLKRKMEEST